MGTPGIAVLKTPSSVLVGWLARTGPRNKQIPIYIYPRWGCIPTCFAGAGLPPEAQFSFPLRHNFKSHKKMNKQFFLLTALVCTLVIGHAQDSSRALPSPLSSPPFPSSDWTGSPIIGAPADAPDYPLQKALGLANDKSRIKIYGWVNPSFNFSSSKNSNVPMSYAVVPNHLELDQVVLRIERQPNTVQTDHVDWGFRLSNV
jgi:hypothetical protein